MEEQKDKKQRNIPEEQPHGGSAPPDTKSYYKAIVANDTRGKHNGKIRKQTRNPKELKKHKTLEQIKY